MSLENVVRFPAPSAVWQPVLLLVNAPVLCQCGELGTVVTGAVSHRPSEYHCLTDVDVWCQSCFEQAQAQNQEP